MLRSSTFSHAAPRARNTGPRLGGWQALLPKPVIAALARLWRGLLWFWTTLLLSWIAVTYITAVVTAGQQNITTVPALRLAFVPAWPVIAALALAALLTPLAFLAARAHRPWPPYTLKPVGTLAPHAGRFIPRYLKPFYLYRVADPDAREALRRAAHRASDDEPLGICVLGWPMLGKTRLAWEAIQAELPDWTLLQWPLEGQFPLHLATLRDKRVVLWLDDLPAYASLNLSPTINDLPRRFAQAGVRFVIVATCRDDDLPLAVEHFSPLLARLVDIHPSEIAEEDAAWHAAALKYQGIKLQFDHFDGTPGSITLGTQRMRQEGYPALPRSARRILWAMKLLRTAGVHLYPVERVRTVARDVFRVEERDWRPACKALLRAGFVRLEPLPGGTGQALVPVASIYLDEVVPDYSVPGTHISDGWPELQKSLEQCQDANALNQLGLAFLDVPLGNRQANAQHAEACFRAAIAIYQAQSNHTAWAIAQRNLGLAHWTQAQMTTGPERALLLAQAVAAFRAALRVGFWEGIPLHCALAYHSLGLALACKAPLSEASQQASLLANAVSAYQEALPAYQRAQARDASAMTQQNLGAALSEQAMLATGEARAQRLEQAIAAYRAALTFYTSETTPDDWATTQNNLGLALMQQADLLEGEERAQRLAEALACHTAALQATPREEAPDGWAITQLHLGTVLRRQADRLEGEARANLLEQAVTAYRAALEVFTQQRTPDHWAMTQNSLGNALCDQALLLEGKERLALLRQAIAAHQAALTISTRDYAPIEWAGIQLNLAQAHLLRARSLKGNARKQCLPLAEESLKRALEVFTPDTAPAYHALAVEAQEEIASLCASQ